jgi:exopolyphosphatase/guanosine-5'-triphosphate,3'-diphosphate pyrophosphatase
MVGSSGTIENLADITLEHFLQRKREAHDLLHFDQLAEVIRMLRQTPLVERINVPGINAERADIIVPGAAILDVLMRSLQQQAVRISDRGLRDGLLFDYLLGLRRGDKAERMSFRKESVMRLGRAVGFEETHAGHVARLALRLFDIGKETQLHDLGEWERELLEYAALLHDIGISLSYEGHHRHSYYFIKHAELLGFNEQEVDIIATTTRYHRKAIPRKKHNEFGNLDPRSQEIVRILSVLLSIAESLDRSHAQLVENIDFIRTENRSIILSIKASKACPLEEWGVDYHRESFERIFNHSLAVEVIC